MSTQGKYESPTTPELMVTFRNYIIELVCRNTNRKIGPRFWSSNDYWRKKYSRETRGVKQLSEAFDFENPMVRTALIQVIQERNIKALVAKKTIAFIIVTTKEKIKQLTEQREHLAANSPVSEIDTKKNARLIDTRPKNKLARIREIENGKKEEG